MRTFNIAGKCIPSMHYMVDISRQVNAAADLVRSGNYFCINRGRQYGKTTTLSCLKRKLESEGYAVFSLSFEGLDDSAFASKEKLAQYSLLLMADVLSYSRMDNLSEESRQILYNIPSESNNFSQRDFIKTVISLCKRDNIVILIDEVDQAGNHIEFIKFLGMLREMYLNRDERPTFQSVVLAGVYDIKNLKLQMRSEDQHQYNSPWNIAVPFDVEMSFGPKDIATMLVDYEEDHHTGMDIQKISELIYEYTEGYPFLVSRMCMLLEQGKEGWNREGVLAAERILLMEKNTLFDDMIKKLDQFPEAYSVLYDIIIKGEEKTFSVDEKGIDLLRMFNFIKNDNGKIAMSNRLFETRLCNLFIAQQKQTEKMLDKGATDRPMFVEDGKLNMRLILERFADLYSNLYSDRDEEFDEDEGRKKFLFYIKPIINGTGNYYMESETRNRRRTDLIIDYLGHQYIIEMKIWNGTRYKIKGEKQITDYLTYYGLSEGYMLTFNFNKKKDPGMHTVTIDGKNIVEMVV